MYVEQAMVCYYNLCLACLTERSSECLTDAASRKRFHILLWEQAAQCYDVRSMLFDLSLYSIIKLYVPVA